MKVRSVLTTIVALACAQSAFADVAADVATAKLKIQQDAVLLSGWLTDQMKVAMPFNSTSGNVVPKQLKLFGFEVGVEGGASGTKVDTNAFHSLNTTVVDTAKVDNFDRMPVPMVMGHAKIGLPFGFDAGVRLGGIPKTDVDKDSTKASVKNKIFGIDLRKALIEEGMTKPFGLTMGLNFTAAKGSIDVTQNYDPKAQITVNGNTYNTSNASGSGSAHTDWNTKSAGVQMILNKQIAFFNPYVGASANKNWGKVNSTIAATETATLTDANDSSKTGTISDTESGSSSATPNRIDVRALAGFELSPLPFLKFGVYGEYAGNKNLAGTLGLRVQFR